MGSLQGGTMLVVGLGGIGSEIAMRADAFNMRVLATARTERPAPSYVDVLGTARAVGLIGAWGHLGVSWLR